ncbi:MFS transporter, FSR family, fosmidomycin resistance protein [Selenomonas sp. KH1T6]|nr:MFS transporter, FSR family, fosmidomycin resistance protein [Selenomonas ruminantium]
MGVRGFDFLNKKYLYMLSAGHLSVDINSGSLPALLPFFVTEYGMDYTSVAGLMFASSCLSSVIQPLFGHLADKGSRQWFMVLGILMAGMGIGLTGFVTDYWLIFAAVTCMGIGSAIFHPEAARNVNAIAGKKKGQGMSIFSVGGNGGFGLGPLLAVFLITCFGMKGTAFYALASLFTAGMVALAAPAIRRESQRQLSAPISQGGSTAPAKENDWPAFARLFVVILFRSTLYASISSFLPLFCIQALGASNAVGSATLSIISISGIVATLAGGWLADKKGYVKTVRYGALLMVPCLAMVVFPQNIWAVYAMLIPMSFAMQGSYAAFVVLGQTYLAKSLGFASGVTLGLSFSLGGMVVPSLGWYADNYGLAAVMLVIFLISVACAAATFLLPEPKKSAGKNLPANRSESPSVP